jgi:hypothetical protein
MGRLVGDFVAGAASPEWALEASLDLMPALLTRRFPGPGTETAVELSAWLGSSSPSEDVSRSAPLSPRGFEALIPLLVGWVRRGMGEVRGGDWEVLLGLGQGEGGEREAYLLMVLDSELGDGEAQGWLGALCRDGHGACDSPRRRRDEAVRSVRKVIALAIGQQGSGHTN